MQIKGLPKDERPREKLLKFGASKLTNAELIALIIESGSDGESAIALAEKILAMDESGIVFLVNCQPEELYCLRGIGAAKAAKLLSAAELGKRMATKSCSEKIRIRTSDDVAALMMQEMRYQKKETFKVILLNVKNEIISVDDTAIGGLSSAYVHPREVFANAIKKSANAIVLVHNHPSGNPEPSQSDILLTRRMIESGQILGIKVADHIIIGDGIYSSILAQSMT